MRLVTDRTGRFRQRPHYEPGELDGECETIITTFMKSLCGEMILPVPTDALTKLIERDAAELDLYADLSEEGHDVQGATDFFSDRKPSVRIARELSEEGHRENRLRTTLTHEYGHVKFHAYLWATEQPLAQPHGMERTSRRTCHRGSIVQASEADWMEWQAGYVCGALLAPVTAVKRIAAQFLQSSDAYAPLQSDSPHGEELRRQVQLAFQISDLAAKVRLTRLGYLVDHPVAATLFDARP